MLRRPPRPPMPPPPLPPGANTPPALAPFCTHRRMAPRRQQASGSSAGACSTLPAPSCLRTMAATSGAWRTCCSASGSERERHCRLQRRCCNFCRPCTDCSSILAWPQAHSPAYAGRAPRFVCACAAVAAAHSGTAEQARPACLLLPGPPPPTCRSPERTAVVVSLCACTVVTAHTNIPHFILFLHCLTTERCFGAPGARRPTLGAYRHDDPSLPLHSGCAPRTHTPSATLQPVPSQDPD